MDPPAEEIDRQEDALPTLTGEDINEISVLFDAVKKLGGNTDAEEATSSFETLVDSVLRRMEERLKG